MKKTELKSMVIEELKNYLQEQEMGMEDDTEQESPSIDEVGSDIKNELLYIADAARGCAEKMEEASDTQIEPWVQSHINAAKELVAHAAEYFGYNEEASEENEEDEEGEEEMEEPVEEPSEETPAAPSKETAVVKETNPIMEVETPQSLKSKKETYLKAKKDIIDQQLKGKTELEEAEVEEGIGKAFGMAAMIASLAFGTPNPTQAQTQFATGVVKGAQPTFKLEKNQQGAFKATATIKDAKTGKTYEGVGMSSRMDMAKRKAELDAMAKMVQAQKADLKEESAEPKKVKKHDAEKVKDFGKEMLAKGEHAKLLKMIKKLEDYIKENPKN